MSYSITAKVMMKVTIDIPDDLYRRVMERTAMVERTVGEVTIDLYQRWLGEVPAKGSSPAAAEWLAEWLALGQSAVGRGDEGPTASDTIAEDRMRLERS